MSVEHAVIAGAEGKVNGVSNGECAPDATPLSSLPVGKEKPAAILVSNGEWRGRERARGPN